MPHLNQWEALEVKKIVDDAIKAERARALAIIEEQERLTTNSEVSAALLRVSRVFEEPKEPSCPPKT